MCGMEESIKRILDGIEKVAPDAWANAVRFTQINAYIGLVGALVMIVLASWWLRKAFKAELDRNGDVQFHAMMGGAFCSVVIVVAIASACSDIATVINPEGRLIMNLISQSKR